MNLVSAMQSEKKLEDVTGIEPVTPCLQIKSSVFQLFGINGLQSGYSVELRSFGLIWTVLRTFSVLICTEAGRLPPRRYQGTVKG
jgi:hypothetical protein